MPMVDRKATGGTIILVMEQTFSNSDYASIIYASPESQAIEITLIAKIFYTK